MTQRARLALATMLLAVLVVVAYAPVEKGVFVWDDHTLVAANRALADQPLARAFTLPFWTNDPMVDARPAYYRPMVVLSYRADLALDEDNESAFHVTNLILHVLATSLLVAVAWRLGASVTAAVVAGALWALAPRLTESVAWVSGRTDVLAAIFTFAALLFWPWIPGRAARAPPRRALVRAALASIALLFALLSKETAVGAAAALIVCGLVAGRPHANPARVAASRGAFVAGTLVAYFVLRTNAMAAIQPRPPQALGAGTRAATVLEAIGRYTTMILDPFHSATSIGHVGDVSLPHAALGATAIVIAIAIHAWALRRAKPLGAFVGTTLAAASLAPVVHVVPIGLSSAVVADRLLYLPLAGLAIAGALVGSRLRGRAAIAAAISGGALAVAFVPAVSARAADYTDELRFRLAAVERAHPANTAPLSGLAWVLRSYREHEIACRVHDLVRARLERTGQTGTVRHTRSLENVAGCFAIFGDYERASEVYESVARDNPASGRVRMEMGYLALHRMDFAGAERELLRALELDPSLDVARALLHQIPALRAELERLSTPEARAADPRAWAVLMARLGRRSDTIAAWVAIVEDPARPLPDASHGVLFLLEDGDFETASRAAATWAARPGADEIDAMKQYVAKRTREHERFVASRARIEALLTERLARSAD